MMIYPLSIGGACIVTSIIGTFFVKLGKSKNIMAALYKGFIVTAFLSLVILYPVTDKIIGLDTIFIKFFKFSHLMVLIYIYVEL